MRGGRAAHTWRASRGTGQGRGGGRTRRTGAPLRVGKGHHVVPPLHFQTPFLLSAHARTPTLYLCVCFRPATLPQHSLLSNSASPLCSVLVLLCVVVLPSAFVVALHLYFSHIHVHLQLLVVGLGFKRSLFGGPLFTGIQYSARAVSFEVRKVFSCIWWCTETADDRHHTQDLPTAVR